jgi:hypothetical protein
LIELAYREAAGMQVALLWCRDSKTLMVSVVGPGSTRDFEMVVNEADALDAFYHPYAHAVLRGIDFDLAA